MSVVAHREDASERARIPMTLSRNQNALQNVPVRVAVPPGENLLQHGMRGESPEVIALPALALDVNDLTQGAGLPEVTTRSSLVLEIGEIVRCYGQSDALESMSSYSATELVGQIQAAIAQLKALEAKAVVVAVGDVPVMASTRRNTSDVSLEDVRSSELGAYLGISPLAARNLSEHCRDLVRWLPETLAHLERGEIDDAKAKVITAGASKLYATVVSQIADIEGHDDERVFEFMRRYERIAIRNVVFRTRSQIKLAANQAVAAIAPLAEEKRHAVAKRERSVEFIDQGTGMTLMQALMTSFDAAKVKNVLEHSARNDSTLTGNLMNKMSDALVNIVTGESDIHPERRQSAAQINVIVSAETLLGVSDSPATIVGTDTVLTANAIRELAETSHLRRMIVDGTTGAPLELGRKSYEPTRVMKDFVKLRDRQCRAPGCIRTAMKCDVDHVQAWDDGGETNVDNLVALCRRHHVLKTIGTWKYELKPNGDTVWQLPDGHIVTDYFDPLIDNAMSWSSPPPLGAITYEGEKSDLKSRLSSRSSRAQVTSIEPEAQPCPF